MRESRLEKECNALARGAGWQVHPKAGHNVVGWPDRTYTRPRPALSLFFVEFKTATGKLSISQRATLLRLISEGYVAHVVRDVATFKRILEDGGVGNHGFL